MPDSNMGQMEHAPDASADIVHPHASPGMDWKQNLPQLAQSFQQNGLMGVGMEGLGLWLKNRGRK